jgi:phosphonate transport system substrate-binding protein
MYSKYQPLMDYLTEETGRSWNLVLSPSYENTVRLACTGQVDVAYLGPLIYLRAHERCSVEPVVRIRSQSDAGYRCVILVRQDGDIRSLTELAGKRFAFGAPLSASAHLVPRSMLLAAGLHPGRDLTCLYLDQHERAARAVLLGDADACGIRDVAGEKFIGQGLRVLATSDPVLQFPFVVTPGAPSETREMLVQALVEKPLLDAKLRHKIEGWDKELASGFSSCRDADFDPARALAILVFGPRYLERSEEELLCPTGGQ